MSKFSGFTSSETFTRIPDSFIQLLAEIEDAAELKVGLYAIWHIEHLQGNIRWVGEDDLEPEMLGLTVKEIQRGLKKCVQRGILLKSAYEARTVYFLNSPRGRVSAEAVEKANAPSVRGSVRIRSNIFKLYEENIGPLTPLIAEMLKDAEGDYPAEWIDEAVKVAVANNKRNWKYIEAILKRWKEEGRAKKQDGRNHKEDGKQSIKRKIEQLRSRSG